ncbi:MAG: transglycosylase SLT domain-containing protein, partial [Methylobacter sp.]
RDHSIFSQFIDTLLYLSHSLKLSFFANSRISVYFGAYARFKVQVGILWHLSCFILLNKVYRSIMGMNINNTIGNLSQVLPILERRGEALSSNLANSDKRDNKSRDLDFKSILKQNMPSIQPMAHTQVRDFTPQQLSGFSMMYRNLNQLSRDRNVSSDSGKQSTLPASSDSSTYSNKSRNIAEGVLGKTKYDSLFKEIGNKYGIDPLLLESIAMGESRENANAVSSGHDYGIMQHNKKFMAERGLNASNWRDPRKNIDAAAKLLAHNIKRAHGDTHDAVRMYNGSGAKARRYADNIMGGYNLARGQILQASIVKKLEESGNHSLYIASSKNEP